MKITRYIPSPPESDRLLNLVLQKMVDISDFGSKTLTANEIFVSIDNDCYAEIDDYDPETGKEFKRLEQIAHNEIDSIEKLFSILNYINGDFINVLDANVTDENKVYKVEYVWAKKFLNEKGYEHLTDQNLWEDQRIRENHNLTKRIVLANGIIAIGTLFAAVYYCFEIMRMNWTGYQFSPTLFLSFLIGAILGVLGYILLQKIKQKRYKQN